MDTEERHEGNRDFSKKEKVNRFLFRCGVLRNNEPTEDAPDIDLVLTSLQDRIVYDIVLAIVKSEEYGIERKLDAISVVLEIDIEDIPIAYRRDVDRIANNTTINIWDYILRVARREDWKDYTFAEYKIMED